MSDINTNNITVGAPAEGASAFVNFSESPVLPTTAAATLDAKWESLGEFSENGYTKSNSLTNNKFKGWHGSVVLSQVASEENTFKLELIEVDGATVNKLRYGTSAVTVDDGGNVSAIDPTTVPSATLPIVIDELLSNGRKRRTVFPRATIESIDDEAHNKGALLVYGITFSANVDEQGRPYYIREAKPVSA